MGVQKIKLTSFFFEKQQRKSKFSPYPHTLNTTVLNVEIKEKEYKRMTKIK
jgi:hypothetical protein